MSVDAILIVVGLAVLLGSGEALVRGASSLARRLGLSEVLVGLTVVAFGTSAPELVVSLAAAFEGQGDIAFGNALGSNVANIGLMLGLTMLLVPVRVHKKLRTREIPFLIIASMVILVLALDSWLSNRADTLGRGDGLVLLLFFGTFLFWNIRDGLRGRATVLLEEAGELLESPMGTWTAVGLTVAGLAGLTAGGHITVGAASNVARGLGVGEVTIAATIVAIGTSLPELATCLVAARRGAEDLAVGNVVGSNLFNTLLVLGLASFARPIAVPALGWVDLAVSAGLAAILLPVALTRRRSWAKSQGIGLIVAYLAYIAFQLWR